MSSYLIFMNGNKAFSPPDMANNVLWLDAKDNASIAATTNLVTQWSDKSGAGNNVTASTTARPTYSATSLGGTLPGITGNGTANQLSAAGTIIPNNSNWTVSMVCSMNGISGNSILAGFGNLAIQGQNATVGRLRIYNSGQLLEANQDAVQSTPYYISLVYRTASSGAVEIWINGEIVGTIASGTYNFTSGTFTLLGALGSTAFGNCTLSEIAVYTRALTPAELNKLHAYFSTRWSFAANPNYQYDVLVTFGDSLMQGHFSGISRTLDNTGDRSVFQYGRDAPHDTIPMLLFAPPQSPGNASSGNVSLEVNLARDYNLLVTAGRATLLMPGAIGGTGFSTNDWNPGNTTYEAWLARVNTALATLPAGSVLKGIHCQIGSNDNTHYTTVQYNAKIAAVVNDIRLRMTGAATVPIIFGPMLPGGTVTDPLIEASLKTIGDSNVNCDYVWGNNLTSVSGDNVHPDVISTRLLGHKQFGGIGMAGTPLVHVDCNRDSSIIRAYQTLTGTATGTSGAATFAVSNSQALFIFAGMRVRLNGTDVYKVQSVATSGTTTVTISTTLSTNYSAGTSIEVEKISQWSDISGNANHFVQATALNMPLYNAGAVFGVSNPNGMNGIPFPKFNGSATFLHCDGIDFRVVGTGGWAFTIVAQKDASARGDPVTYKNQSGGADAFGMVWDSNQHADFFPGGTGSGTPASFTGVAAPAVSSPHIITMVKNSSATNGFVSYVDGAVDVTTTDTADYSLLQSGTQLWLGANRNTSSAPTFAHNGPILEYFAYVTPPTASMILHNHKVLGAKYNIAV